MKEFEKWYNKNKRYNHSSCEKDAWRAALKWVQSRLKFGGEVAYSDADILMAIKKEIREELEATK